MKKLVAAACFALLGTGAFAQTSKGTMVISGAINISSASHESQRTPGHNSEGNRTRFYISPSFGRFYRDGLEVGIGTGFGFERTTNKYMDVESIQRMYSISIGPYIRKFYPITEKLHFTANAGLGFGLAKIKHDIPDAILSNNNTSFTYSVGASPGLTYFATEKLGFFINVGRIYFYKSATIYSDTESKNIETDFNASISLSDSSIGLRYFINR